jgi:streptogramin lyase
MRTAVLLVCLLGPAPAADPGRIDSVAGTGERGYAGDNGPATQARLDQPFHCDLDPAGNLYIAEAGNHCVRRLDRKTGILTTVAGSGKKGYTGDGGPATQATLNEPYAVAVAANGDLFIVDRLNAVVRKVEAKTGTITTAAGNGTKGYGGDGGPATAAMLREPNDCCLDGKGGLLIADVGDWRVRRLDLKTHTLATFAGTGRPTGKVDRSRLGDGGPATQAVVFGARAVCVDGRGNTYLCEREGNAVRKVDTQGVITTVAGTGAKGYGGDGGDAAQATFNGPKALRCDRAGNVYVVDTENHAVRRIDARTNTLTTVAGGRQGAGGDGGPADRAGLDRPHGCVVSPDGVLYIADTNNHRVRRVTPAPGR